MEDSLRPPELDRRSALFLDFDGTLVPIAPRPDRIEVGAWLVPTLQRLQDALDGALALVSGRPLSELDAWLAPLRLPAAGVHGVERRDAAGHTRVLAGALPAELVHRVERLVARSPDLRLEHKPAALALHYRDAPHLGDMCARMMLAAARPHADWTVLIGKCVVEVKPRGATKADAVHEFLTHPAFAGRRPVFVGDDATDEDGFAAVQAVGGLGIKIGAGPSGAQCRLSGPEAVRVWLQAALQQWSCPLPPTG
ncbi:trehalose-phosphatase [Methylibium sp.]|uniref:trehalose-phosphatase n=1 Tax=Methylibium sp. TaxID=2067992 RepID=UPI003D09D161